jgi:ribosomal protein S18 acetylase RimI-like enzyme
MFENLEIRLATQGDLSQIAKIIWHSENTGTEIYSYAGLFDLDEPTFLERFTKILNNEFLGHPLGYRNFYIIVANGQTLGGFALHQEDAKKTSGMLSTGALMMGFNRNEMQKAFEKMEQWKFIQMSKTVGMWQLDSVAIFPEFKGQGIFQRAFDELVKKNNLDSIEVQVWNHNLPAINAYKKLGFHWAKDGSVNEAGVGRVLLNYFSTKK